MAFLKYVTLSWFQDHTFQKKGALRKSKFLGCRSNDYPLIGLDLGGAVAVYVSCICDPVISVRVLHLSHNNLMNYSWCIYYSYLALLTVSECLCTVLCSSSNMCLLQVSLVSEFRSLVSLLQCSQQLEWPYVLGPFRGQVLRVHDGAICFDLQSNTLIGWVILWDMVNEKVVGTHTTIIHWIMSAR